jgi:hypothetical protein
VTDPATTDDLTSEFLTFEAQPITLLDPRTGRAVRALCWALAALVWVWLAFTVVAVIGFVAGFTRAIGL